MKTLDEIKKLMAAGETAQADEALKELLAAEPNNLKAKMLYGTCRQLLGDEETFKRIHDELTSEMERLEKKEPKAETVSLWKKYHALWMSLIVGGLVLAGTVTVAWFVGRDMFRVTGMALPTYDGSEYDSRIEKCLYAGPPRAELIQAEEHAKKFIKTSDEDVDTAK